MTRETLLSLVLLFFVLLVGLMAVGWYTRKRRQAALPELLAVPADPGAVVASFDGFYVSTTPEGEPLNRIAVRGLGFRARVTLLVTERGLIVSLPSQDFWVPADRIREVTTSRYTIDRVVEEDGLVLLAWTLGDGDSVTALDSYFRVDETLRLVDAIDSLVRNPDGSRVFTPDESEKP